MFPAQFIMTGIRNTTLDFGHAFGTSDFGTWETLREVVNLGIRTYKNFSQVAVALEPPHQYETNH